MSIPLYQQLYNHIFDEIREGRLKSGDRVPSEKELADQFQVSLITSKKALEKLNQERLIWRVRGKGSFVASDLPDFTTLNLKSEDGATITANDTHLVGLIIPDFDSSYGLQLVQAVEARCAQLGCHVILKRSYGQQAEETRAIDDCMQLGVSGLMICPVHGEYYNANLLRLVVDEFPLVLVDRYVKGIPTCTVSIDNKHASEQLTRYLIERGHTQIAFASPPVENTSAIEERMLGFTSTLMQYGMPNNPAHYLATLYSTLPSAFHADNIRKDQETLRAFLTNHPEITAVVACEYNIALLVFQTLQQLGRRVPEDCALVCFDSPRNELLQPAFTHIQQDETAMGRNAVDLLLAQIRELPYPRHTLIDFQLIEGRSVAEILRHTQ